MIKLIIIFFMACVFGISIFSYSQAIFQEPYYSKLANRLVEEHIRDMEAKGFKAKSIGGGMLNDVDCIAVGFVSEKTPTIDEARLLYAWGVERLLHLINNDDSIRPYLHNYPFDLHNLNYRISFKELSVDASGVAPIVFVFNANNKIFYCVDDPAFADTNSLRDAWTETYFDALKIVHELEAQGS